MNTKHDNDIRSLDSAISLGSAKAKVKYKDEFKRYAKTYLVKMFA